MTDRTFNVGIQVAADTKSAATQLAELQDAEQKLGVAGKELEAAASGLSAELENLGNQNAALQAFRETTTAVETTSTRLEESTAAVAAAESRQQALASSIRTVNTALDQQRTATQSVSASVDALNVQIVEARARSAEYSAAAKQAGDGDDYLKLKAQLAKEELAALTGELRGQSAELRDAEATQAQLERALSADEAAATKAAASVEVLTQANARLTEQAAAAATAQQAAADKLAGFGIATDEVDVAQNRLAERVQLTQGRVAALTTEFQEQISAISKVDQAYATLGVTSSAALQEAATAARAAFETLRSSGVATAADLDAAFEAVASAELKVAAAAGESEAAVVAAALKAEASTEAQRAALVRLQAQYAETGAAAEGASDKGREGLKLVGEAALALAGISIGAELIKQLTEIADEAKNVAARLKLATDSTEEFEAAQAGVFEVAQKTGVALESTAETYYKLSQAVKLLKGDGSDTLTVLTAINEAVTLSGVSSQTASNGLIQFAQGLASGRLQGQDLRAVLEDLPALGKAVADGLGVTVGELRKLGEQGALTPQEILGALEKAAPKIAEQFGQIPLTVGRSLTELRNSFVIALGSIDDTTGASASLAKAIESLAKTIDELGGSGRVKDAFNAIGSFFKLLVVDPVSLGIDTIGVAFNTLEALVDGAAAAVALALSKITFGETSKAFAQAADSLGQDAKAAADKVVVQLQRIPAGARDAAITAQDAIGATVGALGGMSANTETAATRISAANQKAGSSFLQIKDASGQVSDALLGTLSPATAALIKEFNASGDAASGAAKSATSFADEAKKAGLSAEDTVRGLAALDAAGKITAEDFDKQLSKVLKEISDEDLPRFTRALSADYAAAVQQASATTTQLKFALDALRDQSLARLGLDAKQVITGISSQVTAAIADVKSLGDNSETTAAVITAAFNAALSKVSTREDARAVAAAIGQVKIAGFDAAAAVQQITQRIGELPAAADKISPVGQALERLGVQGQSALDGIASRAKSDFDTVAQSGSQSAGVIAEAFQKSAEAQIKAAAAAGDSQLAVVAGALKAQASTEAQRDAVDKLTQQYAKQGSILRAIAEDLAAADKAELVFQQNLQAHTEATTDSLTSLTRHMDDAAAASADVISGVISVYNDLKARSDDAAEAWNRYIKLVAVEGEDLITFSEYLAKGYGEVTRKINEQTDAASRLTAELNSATGSSQLFIAQGEQAVQSMKYLDAQSLSNLQAALAGAKQRLDDLRASAQSTVSSLQDELDQLEGRQSAIQARQDAAKRAELEAELQAARESGDRQSIQQLQEALRLLQQITQIHETQAQQSTQVTPATSSRASTPATPTTQPPATPAPAPGPSFPQKTPAPDFPNPQPPPTQTVKVVQIEVKGFDPISVLAESEDPLMKLIQALASGKRTAS